jgi:hypothetical protein
VDIAAALKENGTHPEMQNALAHVFDPCSVGTPPIFLKVWYFK